uniref:Sigma 1 n=1 Tax=Mammalian orthoreovirus TaxID=351073 RepID=A0A346M2Y6_9REOV|nr:sigma 1 [Mammalian orthoreovirus]
MSDLVQLIRREIISLTNDGGYSNSRKEIEEIKKQVQNISADIVRLNDITYLFQEQLGNLSTRITTTESRIGENRNRIAGLERDLASVSGGVGDINTRLSALGNRIDVAEQGISRLDTTTSDLSARTSRLESEVLALTTDLSSLNTRVTTEISDIRQLIASLDTRLTTLGNEAVTSVGQGLQKTGNVIRVIVGTGMWFDGNGTLQLFLSNQRKGLGFVDNGMVVKIDPQFFSFDSDGNVTLNSNISELPARTVSLESSRIDVVAPPLTIQESDGTRLLRLLYEATDFIISNNVLSLRNRNSVPTFKFPLELNSADNSVSIHRNYRIRLGQWTGQLEYQTPSLSWRVPVTVNLMRVDDWLTLSFSRFSTGAILASGKFVINFVTGLSAGWATGSTEPSSTTDPLSTTIAAIQYVNGSSRVDAFRILGVTEWNAGELEISNYGGTYTSHTNVDWAPITLTYPCLG